MIFRWIGRIVGGMVILPMLASWAFKHVIDEIAEGVEEAVFWWDERF